MNAVAQEWTPSVELPADVASRVAQFVNRGDERDTADVLRLLERRADARRDGRHTDMQVIEETLGLMCSVLP